MSAAEGLVKRLREHTGTHLQPSVKNDLLTEAADTIASQQAEIERLTARLAAADDAYSLGKADGLEDAAEVAFGFSIYKHKPDHADAPKLIAERIRALKGTDHG